MSHDFEVKELSAPQRSHPLVDKVPNMEPLSITTACMSLLGGTIALSKQIHHFVVATRDARKDMDAFSRELTSLQLCIDSLQHEETVSKFPDSLQRSLAVIIRNCNDIVEQMSSLLTKLSSGSLGNRIQWSFSSREDAERLRNSLEAHKSAIEIALSVSAVAMGTNLQTEATAIKQDTSLLPTISNDVAQISELRTEITALRFQIMQLGQPQTHEGNPLERFLDESVTYAESIVEERSILQPDQAPSTLGHVALTEPTATSSDTTSILSNPFSDSSSRRYTPSIYSGSTSLSEYWEPLLPPTTSNPLAIKSDHHAIEAAHRTRKRFPKWKKDELDHLLHNAVCYDGPDRLSSEQIARTTSLLNLGAKITSSNTFSSDLSSYGTLALEIFHTARPEIVILLISRGARLSVQEHFLRNAMLQPNPNKAVIVELLLNQGFVTLQTCLTSAIKTFNLPVLELCLPLSCYRASYETLVLCVLEGWISGVEAISDRTRSEESNADTGPGTFIFNAHRVLPNIYKNTQSTMFVENCEKLLRLTETDITAATLSSPLLEEECRQHVIDEIKRQFPEELFALFDPRGTWGLVRDDIYRQVKKKNEFSDAEKMRKNAVKLHQSKVKTACEKVVRERAGSNNLTRMSIDDINRLMRGELV